MTRLALLWYSTGLCFFGLNQVITPIFFAFKDTKTPVKIGVFIVGLNIVLSIILMQFMAHAGVALATSFTAMVNFFVLIYFIRKKMPEVKFERMNKNAWKMNYIFLILTVFLYTFVRYYEAVGFWGLLIKCGLFFVLAIIITIFGFHIFKPDYYKEVSAKFMKKFMSR
jgi:putative peptidoglycan lipid II flippase